MKEYEYFLNLAESAISKIDLPELPSRLYDPIRYILGMKGKRIRPVLTLVSCDLFGGHADDAIDAAIGLEIFHNFTLLHDDIMDEAMLRRGKDTVNKKWNINIAILSGDTMFALACRYMALRCSVRREEIFDVFTKTAIEVCEGQQLDMDFETETEITIDRYFEMISLKTAVLLGACTKIGALCANAASEQADMLYDFGKNAGMAFQVQDDLLDSFGNTDKFGKNVGGDIVTNKKTFLYLKCLEVANDHDKERLKSMFSGTETIDPEVKISQVIDIYNKYNIKQLAMKQVESFFNQATDIMQMVNGDPSKKMLFLNYVEWLYKRDF
jgi:geranylgeranyl diphosphate synthase type II